MGKPTSKPTVPALAPHEARALRLRQLAGRIAASFLEFAEVALEAIEAEDHLRFKYLSEVEFFEEHIGIGYRQVRKVLSVVEWLRGIPDKERHVAADGIAHVGLEKAAILVPALRAAPTEWPAWVEKAAQSRREVLQAAVSAAVGAHPRGTPHGPSRILRCLLNALPPDTHGEVEEVLAAVRRVGETVSDEAALLYMIRAMRAELAAHRKL